MYGQHLSFYCSGFVSIISTIKCQKSVVMYISYSILGNNNFIYIPRYKDMFDPTQTVIKLLVLQAQNISH